MHDAVAGDKLGIPAVGIMTSKFVNAAELMARVLGADGYRFVVIDHPISSATEEQLSQQAQQAVAAATQLLLAAAQ